MEDHAVPSMRLRIFQGGIASDDTEAIYSQSCCPIQACSKLVPNEGYLLDHDPFLPLLCLYGYGHKGRRRHSKSLV